MLHCVHAPIYTGGVPRAGMRNVYCTLHCRRQLLRCAHLNGLIGLQIQASIRIWSMHEKLHAFLSNAFIHRTECNSEAVRISVVTCMQATLKMSLARCAQPSSLAVSRLGSNRCLNASNTEALVRAAQLHTSHFGYRSSCRTFPEFIPRRATGV